MPPMPSPPPTMRIPRRSSTLPLARWSSSRMAPPALSGGSIQADGDSGGDPLQISTQPEKRQNGDDDDDCANDVDDPVHDLAFRAS